MATEEQTEAASGLTDLADDTVKLIAYTIVSLKRDEERIMPGGEDSVVITDNMSGEAFAAWRLAIYLQEQDIDPDDKKMKPRKAFIDAEELKYLRVYYVVSHRWPRQPLEFEERQIHSLEKIRDAMP